MTPRPAQPRRRRRPDPRRVRPAFTLVELMISVALVLVLILGINQVFSITSRSVAGGQALSTAIRDNRAAQAVFYDDMRGAVFPRNAAGGAFDNGPALVIRSERVYAYRNRADRLSDTIDGAAGTESPTNAQVASRDLDGDNATTGHGETVSPAIYNERSHRVDRMVFFARGQFRRQTGGTAPTNDTDPFVANMSSPEAYIWYGHLAQPDITEPLNTLEQYVHRWPAEQPYNKNAENAYATSWALGRVVLTMRAPDATFAIYDKETGGTAQNYLYRPAYPFDPSVAALTGYYSSLEPFVPGSRSVPGTPATAHELEWHRYDLAGTTIEEFRDVLVGYHSLFLAGTVTEPWYNLLSNPRYQGNPIPDRPLDSRGVARAAPVFLRGCTQFIVEFAGDFVSQDTNTTSADFGNVFGDNPPVPDGVTDFVVHFDDANNNGQIDGAAERQTVRRVTRWYGMPRDTNGDSFIRGWTNNTESNQMPDVVPLRDVVSSGINAEWIPGAGYAIEHFVTTPANDPQALPPLADYAHATTGMGPEARYLAAWGPDAELMPKPRMIRFTVALDEPGAAMAGEQSYEYIIELP